MRPDIPHREPDRQSVRPGFDALAGASVQQAWWEGWLDAEGEAGDRNRFSRIVDMAQEVEAGADGARGWVREALRRRGGLFASAARLLDQRTAMRGMGLGFSLNKADAFTQEHPGWHDYATPDGTHAATWLVTQGGSKALAWLAGQACLESGKAAWTGFWMTVGEALSVAPGKVMHDLAKAFSAAPTAGQLGWLGSEGRFEQALPHGLMAAAGRRLGAGQTERMERFVEDGRLAAIPAAWLWGADAVSQALAVRGLRRVLGIGECDYLFGVQFADDLKACVEVLDGFCRTSAQAEPALKAEMTLWARFLKAFDRGWWLNLSSVGDVASLERLLDRADLGVLALGALVPFEGGQVERFEQGRVGGRRGVLTGLVELAAQARGAECGSCRLRTGAVAGGRIPLGHRARG